MYQILSKFKENRHYYYKIQTKYGICKIRCSLFNSGTKPNIKSALDKTSYWINMAKEIHDDKYDYSLVKYINNSTKVKIICKDHGVFEQTPHSHLTGSNCIDCYHNSLKLTKEMFILKGNLVHDSFYNYDFIEYTDHEDTSKSIVKGILCPLHGKFSQLANDHLNGSRCQECAKALLQPLSNTRFKKHCDKNNNGTGIFYIIRCFNENEEFFKIGITSRSVKRRFSGSKKLPYKFEILTQLQDISENIFDLETKIKTYIVKNNLNYKPKIYFEGSFTECYKF